MLELRPTDFVPLEEFRLKGRFSDPRHSVLPPGAIADLHPLTAACAATLIRRLQEGDAALLAGSDASATQVDARCNTEQDRARVISALDAMPIAPEQRLVVLWDPVNALETSWRTFRGYWDDFCYPSSDDVTICPIDGDWVLCYHHWEQFSFSHSQTGR